MKLSIIIPMYNVEKHIDTCIKSLLRQDLDSNEYEILIINDGSTDGSVSKVSKFQLNHSNIFLYSQKNAGVGSARNRGISLAKGEYIYFIDPDDYLASNVLGTLITYVQENDLEVLLFSSLNTTNTELNVSNRNIFNKLSTQVVSGIDYIGASNYRSEVWWYILKRSYLQESGIKFIVGRWMEDAIFTAELLLNAKKVTFLPIDAHRHVKVEGSAMMSKEPNHYIKVINDNANAAKAFEQLINEVKNSKHVNQNCIDRLTARQQSFVFFLMIRILKSKMNFKDVKTILLEMSALGTYPLNNFIGKDYNGFVYNTLTKLFNIKIAYYVIFIFCNPVLRKRRFV